MLDRMEPTVSEEVTVRRIETKSGDGGTDVVPPLLVETCTEATSASIVVGRLTEA